MKNSEPNRSKPSQNKMHTTTITGSTVYNMHHIHKPSLCKSGKVKTVDNLQISCNLLTDLQASVHWFNKILHSVTEGFICTV
jgi:hypothetical protein